MPIIVNSVQCIIKQIPINHSSSHIQTQQNTKYQKKKKNQWQYQIPKLPKNLIPFTSIHLGLLPSLLKKKAFTDLFIYYYFF